MKFTTILAFALIALLSAGTAMAQNPHYVTGPTCQVVGLTVNCTGSIAGLGNQDITVVVTATGAATTTCTNPAGKIAPGQTTTVTVTGQVSNLEVKNGKATFSVTTAEPEQPPATPTCPNNKWEANIESIDFTSATIEVYQNNVLVLTTTFTF